MNLLLSLLLLLINCLINVIKYILIVIDVFKKLVNDVKKSVVYLEYQFIEGKLAAGNRRRCQR